MVSSTEYRFDRIVPTPENLRSEAELLRTAFPHAIHYTEQFLSWEYVANPDGHVVGFDAYLDGRLCAHYATQPLTATLFGRPARGLLSFNTATHPDHQGHGLFTALARRTFEAAAAEGYEFVIGVANQNSTPGFTKKLGFQLVSPLQVLVGFGSLRASSGSDADFARTWTHESRSWRAASPRTRYVSTGAGLTCATGKPLIRAILTTESWSEHNDSSPMFLLQHPLAVWMGLAPAAGWRGIAVPLPERLRPSPLNLIFLDLSDATRSLDPHRTHFHAIDFDAY